MAQQVGMGNEPDAGGQAGEGAAGVVGVDRRAPLGAEHQVELGRLERPAGFDPSQRDRLGRRGVPEVSPAGQRTCDQQAMVRRRVLSSCWRCGWFGRSSIWRCAAFSS